MHMCSMRYPLEATQLEDVEVPQFPASRFAAHEPSVQLGRPTWYYEFVYERSAKNDFLSGRNSRFVRKQTRTIGHVLVQRTY